MVKTKEIKAQMQRVGITQAKLAEQLGMNASTLNRKINNEEGENLTVKEASCMASILFIPRDMLAGIFFAESVADTQQLEG